LHSNSANSSSHSHGEIDCQGNSFGTSSEDDSKPRHRRNRRHHHHQSTHDIKVEVPKFEEKLDLDEFIDWLHTVERVFDYKDISEVKKVQLVALRLRKYASF